MVTGKLRIYVPVTATLSPSEIRIAYPRLPSPMSALNDFSALRVLQQIVLDCEEDSHRSPLFYVLHEYRRLKEAVQQLAGFAQCCLSAITSSLTWYYTTQSDSTAFLHQMQEAPS